MKKTSRRLLATVCTGMALAFALSFQAGDIANAGPANAVFGMRIHAQPQFFWSNVTDVANAVGQAAWDFATGLAQGNPSGTYPASIPLDKKKVANLDSL